MPDLVSAVIKPKGRVVKQFFEYFAIELFPEQKELFDEAVQVLEKDKRRLKNQKNGEKPLPKPQVTELLFDEYSRNFPELRYMLSVEADYKRIGQPYRVVFGSLDAVVDGQEFRLIGDLNPIETLRDNNVNFAISSSDLLLAKFVSLLPNNGIDFEDPAQILANLPENTTTMQYDGALKINGSRHMLFMNFKPEKIEKDMKGRLKLEEGTELYVNGEYYLIYNKLFNERYRLNESEKVEPAVLKSDGKRKCGIEVVCTGNTLLEEAKARNSELAVFPKPVYNSTAILISNWATKEYDNAKKLIEKILEINKVIRIPLETTYESMASNLKPYLM